MLRMVEMEETKETEKMEGKAHASQDSGPAEEQEVSMARRYAKFAALW
jgi:hypothetical protein